MSPQERDAAGEEGPLEADQKKMKAAVITAEHLDTQGVEANQAMLQNSATVAHFSNHQTLGSQPSPAHPGAGGLKGRVRASLFGKAPTQKIGRYVIERPLGSGGMGSVFLAKDSGLDRPVAIKLVRYDRVSPHTQARLRREAQALAKLSHPNVVSIFEVDDHEGLLYMAMEYVEGMSLRSWLAAKTRTRETILEVFEQAASGLAAAHRAGLIHRDFKPENVLVGADGRVRIVDFGLVASEGEDGVSTLASSGAAPTQLALTQTGELLGTPAYMAPEQFLGDKPTPASDQFSFFVALHEALVGERPFAGTNVDELMRSVIDGDSRSLRVPALSPALRTIVARGIARDPEDRFPNMAAVLAALGQRKTSPSRRWPLSLALLGGIATLGYLTFAGSCSPSDPPPSLAATPEVTAALAPASSEPDDETLAREALAPLLATSDEDERLRLAADYLAEFGERGGVARRLIAEAARGEILWSRSCPEAREGLCIAVSAASNKGRRCETHSQVAQVERSEVSEPALTHLRLAVQLAAAAPELEDESEARALSHAIGAATALVADAELEAYLDIRPPRGLDFGKSKDHAQLSSDAFKAFMLQKQEAAQRIVGEYKSVKQSNSPAWVVYAAARTGLAYEDFSNSLMSIPLGPSMKTKAQREAYCQTLEAQVVPVRAMAEEVFAYCVSQAQEAGLDADSCSAALLHASPEPSASPSPKTKPVDPTPAPEAGEEQPKQVTVGFSPAFGKRVSTGVEIGAIQTGGPADRAGLRVGDLLVRVGKRVLTPTANDYFSAFAETEPGSPVEVEYMRDGNKHTTMLTPAEPWG